MPHISIDYSPNLEREIDIKGLCNRVRLAAIETGIFPMSGVRVRAFAATHVSIADGAAQHGYIDINVRLRAGRDLAAREAATQHIFEMVYAHLAPVMERCPIALSFEMRDIDPALAPKAGTIRNFLPGE